MHHNGEYHKGTELGTSSSDSSLGTICSIFEMDFRRAVIHHGSAPLHRPDTNCYITVFMETAILFKLTDSGSRGGGGMSSVSRDTKTGRTNPAFYSGI